MGSFLMAGFPPLILTHRKGVSQMSHHHFWYSYVTTYRNYTYIK
jgi:hypothetical protein